MIIIGMFDFFLGWMKSVNLESRDRRRIFDSAMATYWRISETVPSTAGSAEEEDEEETGAVTGASKYWLAGMSAEEEDEEDEGTDTTGAKSSSG
jgi:hypothetical protein